MKRLTRAEQDISHVRSHVEHDMNLVIPRVHVFLASVINRIVHVVDKQENPLRARSKGENTLQAMQALLLAVIRASGISKK